MPNPGSRRSLITLLTGIACATLPVSAEAAPSHKPTINDYGGVGLLETRTARFMEEGGASIGGSYVVPYKRFWGTFQPFPWLEATFRFTDIITEKGATDRSFDAKIRLLKEGPHWPQVAIGFQDLAGTGRFSSEYLVASRRVYDFDFSFGVAWGRLGSRTTLRNPFTYLSDSFEIRRRGKSTGGTPGVKSYFRGPRAGLFGGVEYSTPVKGLRLLAEYDSDAYLRARQSPRVSKKTPFNFGVAYQPVGWADFSVAYERGDKFMVRGTLLANFMTAQPAPKFDKLPERVAPRQALKTFDEIDRKEAEVKNPPMARRPEYQQIGYQADWSPPQDGPGDVDVDRLFDLLDSYGYQMESFHFDGEEVTVEVTPLGLLWRADDAPLMARAVAASVTLPARSFTLSVQTPEGGQFRTTIDQAPQRVPEVRFAARQGGAAISEPKPNVPQPDPFLHLATFGEPLVLDVKLRQKVAERLIAGLGRAGFVVDGVSVDPQEVLVLMHNKKFFVRAQGLGRAARIVANRVPDSIEVITLVSLEKGLEVSRVSMLRKDVEMAARLTKDVGEIWHSAKIEGPDPGAPEPHFRPVGRYPDFDFTIQPKSRQSLFDPENPFLFQIYMAFGVKAQLAADLSMRGQIGLNIFQNFTDSRRPAGSVLPHVRSDIMRYLQKGKNNLETLQVDYVRNIGRDWYGRISAGYFEQMYGGFSGEVLYAPYRQLWTVGLDLNQVWKREFKQRLGFQDYNILTGHLSINYELPSPRVLATVRAGRYLARDIGATFEVTRIFDSGVQLGGFFTLTDVPAEEFGEGSFDKGISISVPLDLLLTNNSRRVSAMTLRPLFRDGGQMVNVSSRLYSAISKYSYSALDKGWDRLLD